eukprot:CAMPEP_0170640680 /NCGR_PEP_ID=MMETSP0224-20130122/40359_1 /TAXON_ID=285029 /ORGANISM="Togula jolla, Strain CCCM 725" /LENGTH=936 /DNA_ID=CAMNT_0010971213 /DNA_START=32 /DNA_END=2842 /DNA_ORIENTATION=+
MPPFTDPDFPAESSSIGNNKHKDADWRRIKEIQGVTNPPKLFGNIEADGVEQGELGDCWLLAALACIADFPGHIEALFSPREYSEEGRYEVRLFDITEGWTTVVLDDRIPARSWGIPCFCQVQSAGGVWALLLEKAFAKFTGSYQRLNGGGSLWAYQVLTGITPQLAFSRDKGSEKWQQWKIHVQKQKDFPVVWRQKGMKGCSLTSSCPVPTYSGQELFGLLAYFDQCNCLMSASCHGSGEVEGRRDDGLVEGHAYSVLSVQKARGKTMIKLRNPWGSTEWTGPFSDKCGDWEANPELKEDLALEVIEDGEFWMPWESFDRIFDSIYVSPGNLCVPRHSSTGGKKKEGLKCRHCHYTMTRVWCMTNYGAGLHGEWQRLQDGDLCFMCRRAQTGIAEVRPELKSIPGIDSFPLEPRLTQPEPPRSQPICKYGPSCYRHNPEHFASYSHPWLGLRFGGKAWRSPGRVPRAGSGEAPAEPAEAPAEAPEEPSAEPTPATPASPAPVTYDVGTVHKMLNLTKKGDWTTCFEMFKQYPGLVDERPSGRNWAAIHRAAADDQSEALRSLVEEHGADAELLTGDSKTALQVAEFKSGRCMKAVAYLKSLFSDRGPPPMTGQLLRLAKAGEWRSAFLLLAEHPAAVNSCAPGEQYCAIHVAAQQGRVGAVQHLVEVFGANPTLPDEAGALPADLAEAAGHEVVALYLRTKTAAGETDISRTEVVTEGVDPSSLDEAAVVKVETPEMFLLLEEANLAAREGSWDAAFEVLSRGPQGLVDLREPGRPWATIHQAAFLGDVAVLRRLVEDFGADPQLPTIEGAVPREVAERHGCLDAAAYLGSVAGATVGGRNIDFEAYESVLESFRHADENGDGTIDRAELSKVLQSLSPDDWTDDKIDLLLSAADTNKDGRVQLTEWLQWIYGQDPSKTETRFDLASNIAAREAS